MATWPRLMMSQQQAGSALQSIQAVVQDTNAEASSIGNTVRQMTASVEAVNASAERAWYDARNMHDWTG